MRLQPRVRRGPPARSRRRRLRLAHRQHRRRPDRQYRPLLHRAQAARRARAHVLADHRPAAAAARQGPGRQPVPAADAGHHRRRPHLARQLPVHAAGLQHRRAERMVAEDAGEDADAAADRRRVERSPGERAAAQGHHQSRPGLALRHLAADDRRHPQRRLRPAPDHAVFHPAQYLLDHPRNPARAADATSPRSTAST